MAVSSGSDSSVKGSACLSANLVSGGILEIAEDDGDAAPAEFVELRGEGAGLAGAARRAVLGVEVEDDALSAEVGQGDGVAVLVVEGEIRCGAADVHGSGLSPVCWSLAVAARGRRLPLV